jgi:chromosome segregation ATPase
MTRPTRLTKEREQEIREQHGRCSTSDCLAPELLAEIDALREHLDSRGVHTCHAKCQNPICLMRRQRDALRAELEILKDPSDGRCMEIVALREHNKKLREELESEYKERKEAVQRYERSEECATEMQIENARLRAVADAARFLVDSCDCGCSCGYYTEDATEETGMNICGLCGTKDALAALDNPDGGDGGR